MPDLDASDLYARLGIPQGATSDEIKRAYLALVRDYTPERAPEAFKRIREAYETLSNPVSRRQYDARPDPRIAALLDQASEAMKAQDYPVAEQAYKKVLLERSDLHWVRNLLGLCFLYQEQSDKAIAQYERLIFDSSADASTHANAAHAYRLAKRFDEAEREFRVAMRLGGDQAVEYGLALIQMTAERGKPERADKLALAEAASAAAGSTAAAEYAAKRIELALFLGRKGHIPSLLAQVVKGLSTEDQRRYAALALGKVANRLIAGEAFEPAEQVAKTAKGLQPDDPDYDGQEQASRLLHVNDFDALARLLKTHVSFATNGWLQGLKPMIQRYCTTHTAFKGMRPIISPPALGRVNGIGTAIHGRRDEDPQTGTYVVTQYFTFFFVPLFPIACYRVRQAPTGGWFFLGRVSYGRGEKTHWAVFMVLAIVWLLSTLLDQNSTSNGAARPAYAPPASPSVLGVASDLDSLAESMRPALATYEGEAVNTTLPSSPLRASIRLTVHTWQSSPSGYFRVFRPLGGSGPLFLAARGDSVRFGTISAVGDTIVWFGARVGTALTGKYLIVGGQFRRQHGTWRLSLTRGTPIPRRLNPW
jgi:curved DNA-binding protein CbpA